VFLASGAAVPIGFVFFSISGCQQFQFRLGRESERKHELTSDMTHDKDRAERLNDSLEKDELGEMKHEEG